MRSRPFLHDFICFDNKNSTHRKCPQSLEFDSLLFAERLTLAIYQVDNALVFEFVDDFRKLWMLTGGSHYAEYIKTFTSRFTMYILSTL